YLLESHREFGGGVGGAVVEYEPVFAGSDKIAEASQRRDDGSATSRHRFEHGQAERLAELRKRRINENGGFAILLDEAAFVETLTDQLDAAGRFRGGGRERFAVGLAAAALRGFPGADQARRPTAERAVRSAVEGVDEQVDALLGMQPAGVEHDGSR